MEEKRLDRRSFLKYAGVGSLATLSLMAGGARTARAQLGSVLEFLGTIPENVLAELPQAIAEINADPEKHMEFFMSDPRAFLAEAFDIKLEYTKYQLIAFDLSGEETPWAKLVADPPYPYEAEVKIGPVAIGFAEGRVGLVLRERGA